MFRTMGSRVLLAGALSVAAILGVCLAGELTVNINPHKIVLNAQGKSEDIQANVPMSLPSANIVEVDVTLSIDVGADETVDAAAFRARYCLIDDILIIDFDRASLQEDLAEALDELGKTSVTATATVDGSVTVIDAVGVETTRYFNGSDTVEIVKPGKKR